MTIYASTQELYDVLLPFYNKIVTDPDVGPQFAKSGTSFRIRHTDPDAVFLLDATAEPLTLLHADAADAAEPEVDLLMSADDGHKFWLGQLNLPIALARKKIKVTGGVTKLLGLVPALSPAYEIYRSYLTEIGRSATA